MKLHPLALIAIDSAVAYRVARFAIEDALFDTPRNALMAWLTRKAETDPRWRNATDLLECPWCLTVWTAAGAIVAGRPFTGPVRLPVWSWLAVATGAMAIWQTIEPDED